MNIKKAFAELIRVSEQRDDLEGAQEIVRGQIASILWIAGMNGVLDKTNNAQLLEKYEDAKVVMKNIEKETENFNEVEGEVVRFFNSIHPIDYFEFYPEADYNQSPYLFIYAGGHVTFKKEG